MARRLLQPLMRASRRCRPAVTTTTTTNQTSLPLLWKEQRQHSRIHHVPVRGTSQWHSAPIFFESEAADLLSNTRNFLDRNKTLNSEDPDVWNEACALIRQWTWDYQGGGGTELERSDLCFSILDRLAEIVPPEGQGWFASVLLTDCFNAVLWIWSQAILNRQPQEATSSRQHPAEHPTKEENHLSLHEVMEKVEKYRWASLVQPNAKSFNLILEASSSYSTTEGVVFADDLLRQLLQVDQERFVNHISFGIVMKHWARLHRGDKVEKWLNRLSSSSSSTTYAPNASHYHSAIFAWARSGHVERAEKLLQRQLVDYRQGNEACRPDMHSFNAVLDGWARTTTKDVSSSHEHAERLWQQLLALECTPDAYSVSNVIRCHVKSRGPRLAEERLAQFPRDETVTIVPYNVILHAYAQQGQAHEAERLMEQTININDNDNNNTTQNNPHIRPDHVSFQAVLQAWANHRRSKDHDDDDDTPPRRAEAWLAAMEYGWKLPPTGRAYSSVQQAWATSGLPEAAERVEAWLREAIRSSRSNRNRNKNKNDLVVCYHIALTAWGTHARLFRDDVGVERAERLLKELLVHDDPGLSPTAPCFRAVLHGVVGSTVSHKLERAQEVVQLMERHGVRPNQADDKILRRLEKRQSKISTY